MLQEAFGDNAMRQRKNF